MIDGRGLQISAVSQVSDARVESGVRWEGTTGA